MECVGGEDGRPGLVLSYSNEKRSVGEGVGRGSWCCCC